MLEDKSRQRGALSYTPLMLFTRLGHQRICVCREGVKGTPTKGSAPLTSNNTANRRRTHAANFRVVEPFAKFVGRRTFDKVYVNEFGRQRCLLTSFQDQILMSGCAFATLRSTESRTFDHDLELKRDGNNAKLAPR